MFLLLNFASCFSRRSFPVLTGVRQRGLVGRSGRWQQAVGLGVALCAVPVVEVPPAAPPCTSLTPKPTCLSWDCILREDLAVQGALCLSGARREGCGKVTRVSCVAAAEPGVPQQRCPDQKSRVAGDRQHGHAALPDHLRADRGAHRVHQGQLRGFRPGTGHCCCSGTNYTS